MTREEILKNAKPILFNTEMVKAIMEDRKTVTRRVVKTELPEFLGFGYDWVSDDKAVFGFSKYGHIEAFKPKYQVGDILYVRETWNRMDDDCGINWFYKATDDMDSYDDDGNLIYSLKWKPSIHMPKEAARIFLKVTNVRVERLQDMKVNDLEKEGLYCDSQHDRGQGMLLRFIRLWDSTINKQDFKKYEWYANPYVWVIEFEKVSI